ncbi:MAG: TIR domain-containing protein [Hyphomonadaceae bacterium]
MPDIFRSYNREDQPRAKLFADAFNVQGFDVWWDVGLTPGEAYDQVTEKALKEARSRHSTTSLELFAECRHIDLGRGGV